MTALKRSFLKLNRLILFTALTATVVTFFNSFYSNYEVQKEQLIHQGIEVNSAYAKKLSETTELFLNSSQQQLAYVAKKSAANMADGETLKRNVDQLKYQTNTFNSVVISSADGIALAASPETLQLVGKQLRSSGSLEPLERQEAMISAPYMSALNNLLIVLSAPIFNDGLYLGYIGGTIYLKKDNILNGILGKHFYKNGSYIYVIDQEKHILYHPNQERIGSVFENNDNIDEIVSKSEGGMILTNSQNIEMLVGYAKIPSTGWTIITQSPLESSLLPLTGIMEEVVLRTLPIGIAVFAFIWIFALAISRPLQQLADKAKYLDNPTVNDDIEKINSWYVESFGLKKAILSGVKILQGQIGQLQHDVETDPLTGANNRRAFELKLKQLSLLETPISVLAIDIDYFKKINDTYGHDVGDDVLIELTKIINSFSDEADMVVRMGGEEFILLLHGATVKQAFTVAEKLRVAISENEFSNIGHITVSIGVAAWPNLLSTATTINKTISLADQALYEAKGQGRNCCIVASDV